MGNKPVQKFFNFVHERHSIYHKRFILKQPAPWTEDPILQKYKFCNVYRELDRGTIWMMKNTTGSTEDKIFQVIQYRLLNNPAFFEEYPGLHGLNCVGHLLEKALNQYKKDHGAIFNSAYTTFKTFNAATGLRNTIASYCYIINYICYSMPQITKELTSDGITAEESCRSLTKWPGIGEFLAYEIWCDLILMKVVKWCENDFVNVGPGAIRGLEIIFEGSRESNESLCESLRLSQTEHLPPNYPGKELSLRSIEHSLCEYRKYCHLKQGRGRPRLFKPYNPIKNGNTSPR